MIIKKAKYKKVRAWTRKQVSPEVHGCDRCEKVITKERPLDVAVFYMNHRTEERDTEHLHLCSWKCVFDLMKNIQRTKYKCDYFVTLPMIMFDEVGENYKEFVTALKKAGKE